MRIAADIAETELQEIIITATFKALDQEYRDAEKVQTLQEFKDFIKKAYWGSYLSIAQMETDLFDKHIYKDLKKVEFDFENFYSTTSDDSRLGLHTINGIAHCLCIAGGDWEEPVLFTIYYDGKNLRAYIPSKGNCYNKNTKEAYGNDEEADSIFIPDVNNPPEINIKIIKEDIAVHFKKRN